MPGQGRKEEDRKMKQGFGLADSGYDPEIAVNLEGRMGVPKVGQRRTGQQNAQKMSGFLLIPQDGVKVD